MSTSCSLQEALADQLDVLGILAVGLETVKESVSNYMQHMQKYTKCAIYAKESKICTICKNITNMQNMTYTRISQAKSSSTPS